MLQTLPGAEEATQKWGEGGQTDSWTTPLTNRARPCNSINHAKHGK